MKRFAALALICCFLCPLCAFAQERAPEFTFQEKNYVGYLGKRLYIEVAVKYASYLEKPYPVELRDQTGRVWASRSCPVKAKVLSFQTMLDESHLGGFDLSVWSGDVCLSTNTAYVAICDRSVKAITTLDTDQPYMSVSIDCAFVGSPTDKILAVLDEYNVKATFFMTGGFVEEFPEQAKKIRDAGHEIACHSVSHPHLLERNLNSRFHQVRHASEIIREQLNVVPRLFRPPYGEFDSTVTAAARSEGMEICMWTIDSHDWDESYTQDQIIRRVKRNVGPGTIILFHLDGFKTPSTLQEVIPYYQDTLGLTLVPISELCAISGRELPANPYE